MLGSIGLAVLLAGGLGFATALALGALRRRRELVLHANSAVLDGRLLDLRGQRPEAHAVIIADGAAGPIPWEDLKHRCNQDEGQRVGVALVMLGNIEVVAQHLSPKRARELVEAIGAHWPSESRPALDGEDLRSLEAIRGVPQ